MREIRISHNVVQGPCVLLQSKTENTLVSYVIGSHNPVSFYGLIIELPCLDNLRIKVYPEEMSGAL